MWFPIDTQSASIINGVYEIDFTPNNRPRVLQWITLKGPANSQVSVYLDTIFMDTTPRGDFNRADYYNGIPIAGGRLIRLVWNVGTGTVPTASIGCTDGDISLLNSLTGAQSIFTQ